MPVLFPSFLVKENKTAIIQKYNAKSKLKLSDFKIQHDTHKHTDRKMTKRYVLDNKIRRSNKKFHIKSDSMLIHED